VLGNLLGQEKGVLWLMGFKVFLSSSSGKSRNNNSNRSRQIPLKSFPVYHSSVFPPFKDIYIYIFIYKTTDRVDKETAKNKRLHLKKKYSYSA
jgi:hypothetical protein